MAASDRYDEFATAMAELRTDHARELQQRDDQIFRLSLETEMLKGQLTDARNERAAAVRTTVQLITQFATVEQVFATAKQLALQVDAYPEVQGIVAEQRNPVSSLRETPGIDEIIQASSMSVSDAELEALRNGHIPERFATADQRPVVVATHGMNSARLPVGSIEELPPIGAATERLRAMK